MTMSETQYTASTQRDNYTLEEWDDAHALSRSRWVAKWHGGHSRWTRLRTLPHPGNSVTSLAPSRVADPVEQVPDATEFADYYAALKGHAASELATDTDLVADTIDLSHIHKPVGWFFTGDWHVGSKWVEYTVLEDDMRFVGAWCRNHPGALLKTHTGDPVDGFLAHHAASSGLYEELVTRIDKQEGLFLWVAQLAGAWDYIHYGCHSAWTLTRGGRDPVTPLITALNTQWRDNLLLNPEEQHAINRVGAKNAGYGIDVRLQLGSQTYQVVSRHRMRRESSLNTTNAMRAVDDDLGPAGQRADAIVLGHMHNPDLQIRRKAGRDVIYARTGAYKGGDCFSRAIGATMSKAPNMGNILIIFDPNKHETMAFDWRWWRMGLATLARLRGETV